MDSLSINTETGAGPVEQSQTTSGRSLAELEHIVEKGKSHLSRSLRPALIRDGNPLYQVVRLMLVVLAGELVPVDNIRLPWRF